MIDITRLYIDGDLIMILTIAIVCDMVSGVIKAIIGKEYKSGNFRTGLLKKILDYVIVIVSILVGYILQINYIENGTVTVLIFMELSSIIENCKGIISIPKALEDIIEKNTEESEAVEDVKG